MPSVFCICCLSRCYRALFCHFVIHLYNSAKIFPVRNWTRLLDAELPLFYQSSVWRVQIFVINLCNQISWLIFAALWTEKEARVVVILAVKDSETQLIIRLLTYRKIGIISTHTK